MLLTFLETSMFTRQVVRLLSDDRLADLQNFLCEHPDFGKIIKGSGGIRKVRWSEEGQGKRGGVRVLYYWVVNKDQILLLDIYAKSDKEEISPAELKVLKMLLSGFET